MRADQCPKCKLFKVNYDKITDQMTCRNCGLVISRRPTAETCPWFSGNECPELDIAVCHLCMLAETLLTQKAADWPQLCGQKNASMPQGEEKKRGRPFGVRK